MPNALSDFSPRHHASAADLPLLAALQGFPRPASVTTLNSPPLPRSLDAECAASHATAIQPSLPEPVSLAPTTPRSIETQSRSEMSPQPPTNDLNLIVGGTLAPAPDFTYSLNTVVSTSAKIAKTDLRLPSFELLGIAAPHPDRPLRSYYSNTSRIAPCHSPEVGGGALGSLEGILDHGRHSQSSKAPVRHFVTTITPPNEGGEASWTTTAVANAPIDSPETEPAAVNPPAPPVVDVVQDYLKSVQSAPLVGSTPTAFSHEWVVHTIQQLLLARHNAPSHAESLRVLSHALPCPSTNGHVYPAIIHAIHDPKPDNPTTWINVFHAVPGRFNLSDLPLTSPPSTPGPAINGDDYFTQKFLFDTAVSITDYQQDLSALPRSPRPVVPPGSINVAIVERYIPPSNHHELADMFNPRGPSVLVDRLVELSPQNSHLVFIYPTRRGGETFQREYLGPIFGKTLLHIATVNDISPEMGHAVSNMPAVSKLLDYDEMAVKMRGLCQKLSRGAVRGVPSTSRYDIIHSETQQVVLPRRIWSEEWWAKQEKTRIRETLARYLRLALESSTKRPGEQGIGPMTSEILNTVTKTPYPAGQEPQSGIEVSIFIVQRSA